MFVNDNDGEEKTQWKCKFRVIDGWATGDAVRQTAVLHSILLPLSELFIMLIIIWFDCITWLQICWKSATAHQKTVNVYKPRRGTTNNGSVSDVRCPLDVWLQTKAACIWWTMSHWTWDYKPQQHVSDDRCLAGHTAWAITELCDVWDDRQPCPVSKVSK